MKPTISALLLCCAWLTTTQAQITLNGTLQTDAEKPVPDIQVGVAGGPAPNTTDSKGQFSLRLSLDFIEGERVILIVQKKDWVINSPLDGEWNLPNIKLQNVQFIKVIIVPKGSKALWTHARIEKHIGLLSDELAKLKKEGDQPRPIDFSYYLSEWANQYDFTPTDVKAAFDQWAKQVENSEDYRTLGLRAFYQKNFAEAAANFEKAALQGQKKLKALREEVRQETLQTYADWKDAGNSLSNLYRFEEALAKYDSAGGLVAKEDFPNEWSEIRIFIGNTKREIGIRVEGEKANRLLQESEAAYREALQVYTREQLPQDWAGTQNNLGLVYNGLGTRTGGEEGAKLLKASVTAYENALVVHTREQLPQQWATTQNNLGNVFCDLGTRTGGEEGAKWLKEAVTAYENALVVHTREQLPQQWATTQNNLGTVYRNLGTRTGGEEGAKWLKAAVTAYENALVVHTREQLPQQWATTQNNLGVVYRNLGTRTGGEEGAKLLQASVTAYENALVVRTREQLPQDWAGTQNNLGLVYNDLGTRTGGEEGAKLLRAAVTAYENALVVRTREQLPQQWATTQNNLGIVYWNLGTRTGGEEGAKLLRASVTAFENALVVRTREQLPQDWAGTQNNLGAVYSNLGTRTGGEEGAKWLKASVTAYENALVVYTREQLPQQWAATQNNLGNVYWNLGTRTGGEEGAKLLKAAVTAYENALVVRTREQLPQDWAMTQNNLGTVLRELGTRTGGEEGARLLAETITAYKLALEIRSFEYLQVDWAQTQNNLAETYDYFQDWPNVAACYANVLKVYPDYEKACKEAVRLYHEIVFDFEKAFELNQEWLMQQPNDLLEQIKFVEKHFTSGRFVECELQIERFNDSKEYSSFVHIVVGAINIANLLALNKSKLVPAQLNTLQTTIASQPDSFQVGWSFNGTKHFISQNEKLAPHRAWLLQLFEALEIKEGRKAILAALHEVRKKFGVIVDK